MLIHSCQDDGWMVQIWTYRGQNEVKTQKTRIHTFYITKPFSHITSGTKKRNFSNKMSEKYDPDLRG